MPCVSLEGTYLVVISVYHRSAIFVQNNTHCLQKRSKKIRKNCRQCSVTEGSVAVCGGGGRVGFDCNCLICN